MQHTTARKWQPNLVCTCCALALALSAGPSVLGQTLADVTRPVPRGARNQPAEWGQTAPTDAAMPDEPAAAPKKKSWTNWLPWQRDKQSAGAAKARELETPTATKSVTVNRPSSPRGRDRHFPPPQPVTDPVVVASVQGVPTATSTKAPKQKKSLLQSLRKPSWLPFTQREEVAADQTLGDERQPVSSGTRPTNVVEYPDVVPPKYRTGALNSSRPTRRDEPTAEQRPASETLAGSNHQSTRIQRQVLDAEAPQAGSATSATPPARDESLPTATPSLVRSFRRPPPDPVPALPEEANTEVVSANKPATSAISRPSELQASETEAPGTTSTSATASTNTGSGDVAVERSVPVMLQSVPQRNLPVDQPAADQSAGGLHFVPTDLAARERAQNGASATHSGQSNKEPASAPATAPKSTESSTAQSGVEMPSTTWTAKRLATTAGAPNASVPKGSSNDLTKITATGERTTKIDTAASTSVPGQAEWQINPFAPPPASRAATWPDTGPRRMASTQTTPPAALRPLPAGSNTNLAKAATEANTAGIAVVERTVVEKTPSQIQPSMTTRVSAVEPVNANRDQAVEPVATDTSDESAQPNVVNAANTSEAADVPDASEPSDAPEMAEPLPESRSSSDPAGSWVDAYRQLMQRNGQTYRRPTAGSPTRRLSSDDAPAAPVRRR